MSRGVIDKNELITIAVFLGFSFFWVFLIMPFLQNSEWFSSLSPLIAYPIYNIGFIFLIGFFFGGLLTYFLKKRVKLFNWIVNSVLAFFFLSNFYDLYQGPFYLAPNGCVAITAQSTLANTSVDAFYYTIFNSIIGTTCQSIYYYLVYFIVPITTIIAIAFFGYLQWKDIF